ncbi:type VII secretion-associated serine protease mycosin [Catenulispora sp. NL8]|uniref:Type VII secretion-associated serine protease mycosin n=1 Tax=Catenulispora pinistramenti TaxID=2705254 RepID=A0ABS5L325_9ACTN|nr:type VII secretion-associated serine protease mycosin [Catenulispora pinistramenti]MBS2552746.1 type VII secretion-associated serine protease mycosin [Catenulispora pinistramenti]
MRRAASVAGVLILSTLPYATATAPADAATSTSQTCPDTASALPAVAASAAVPWAQTRLDLSRVWPLTRGDGVKVAVIDTGVDAGVPQLSGHVDAGADVIGTAGVGTLDCHGHGTAVAGIIAAQPAAGTGFAGVAPGARIIPVRQSIGDSDGTAGTLALAIRRAADLGSGVINTSLVSLTSTPELRAAVEYAQGRGAVIVAAAGNQQQSGDPRTYPAAYPGVIAVAATGPDDAVAQFSETGDYVAVAAPGVQVASLARGPGDVLVDGTSFAAPFVSGVVALVRAYHPGLSPEQVRHRIEVTADHPAGALPGAALGWGIVNPYSAVTAVLPEEGKAAKTAVVSPGSAPAGAFARRPAAISAGAAGFAAAAGGIVLAVWAAAAAGRKARRASGDEGEGGERISATAEPRRPGRPGRRRPPRDQRPARDGRTKELLVRR